MTRPEFKIKITLAGVFGFFKGFGVADLSVWKVTAAQRAILLGPDEEKETKKPKKRYSLAELRALTEANKQSLGLEDHPDELSS